MEEKYIKFYKTFHKKFKNDKNLIHCFELLSDSRVIYTKYQNSLGTDLASVSNFIT